jgi:hypothetical protein
MPLLFSYGILQQENVQLSTFGRLLQGQRDELLEFERSLVRIADPQVVATSGKTHHANVTFNGRNDSRVNGTVFYITDAELAAADQYEQPAAYKRIAAVLASGNRHGCALRPTLRRKVREVLAKGWLRSGRAGKWLLLCCCCATRRATCSLDLVIAGGLP